MHWAIDGWRLTVGRGSRLWGRRIAFLGKDEGEGITSLGQLVWIEGEGGA